MERESDGSIIRVVIVVLSGVILMVLLGGFFVYKKVLEPIMSGGLQKPVILSSPGVIGGAGVLKKVVFASDGRLGAVTDIQPSGALADHEEGIVAVSAKAAVFFDKTGKALDAMTIGSSASHVDLVFDGADYLFMNRGSWGTEAMLMDSAGKELWSYGGSPGINDMSVGDLDGDGDLEYVVGFNGGGGVRLLDHSGKKLWAESGGNIWHVEIVDTTGTGTMRVVHSDAAGSMTVRDASGKILKNTKPGPYFSAFSVCPWPTGADRTYALMAETDKIWLFDYDGSTIAKYAAPDCGMLGAAYGTPVKLSPTEPPHFAVVVNFSNWTSAILYVYDATQKLIYREVIPESCAALSTLPSEGSNTEALLIGGTGKVWSYQLVAPVGTTE